MTDFTKEPSDALGIAESEAKNVGLDKSDSLSISETLFNGIQIPLADVVSFADSEIEAPDKILDDTLFVSEAIAKAIVKPALVDSISFAESISKIAVQLNLTANQTFAEEIAKNVVLGKTDTLSIAEAVAKAMGLYKEDNQSLSEAEAWFFNKIITDQITPLADSTIEYDVTQEVWWGMIKWRTACHCGI